MMKVVPDNGIKIAGSRCLLEMRCFECGAVRDGVDVDALCECGGRMEVYGVMVPEGTIPVMDEVEG